MNALYLERAVVNALYLERAVLDYEYRSLKFQVSIITLTVHAGVGCAEVKEPRCNV